MNNKRIKPEIPARFILFVLATIAIIMLFVSYTTGFSGGYLRTVEEYIFVPMQKGIETVSNRIMVSSQEAKTMEQLSLENETLRAEVERLSSELSNVSLRQSELEELRTLFELKKTYSDYETTGASVIGGSTSNWSSSFIIDKGTDDGLTEKMNVLAGEGLVGIITRVGKNYAVVQSIIDDTVNISATVSSTGDNLIVTGSLESMTSSGMINISNLEDKDGLVEVGSSIVTSNISDKFVPGLLIGYVSSIQMEPSGLTKSGTIVPVADFKHLNEVLVVTTVKQTGE